MNLAAIELIENCLYTEDTYLDLGRCGLIDYDFIENGDVDIILRQCVHIKTLILSNYWWDFEKNILLESRNRYKENILHEIPVALRHLTELREFICCGNENVNRWGIKDIYNLSKSNRLTYLDLSNNRISEVNNWAAFESLSLLNINNNNLLNIPELNCLQTLKILWIGKNKIKYITNIYLLSNIEELSLDNNQIEIINGLEGLVNLKKLYLNNNKLSNIENLKKNKSLLELDLGYNNINDFNCLDGLSLTRLNIRHNNITALSFDNFKFISQLFSLDRTQLYNTSRDKFFFLQRTINDLLSNPVIVPNREVILQGDVAIMNYFDELEKQGADILYEAKMLIVGQPRAGKTSLRYKLFDVAKNLPSEDETTRGIDIERLEFDIVDKLGVNRKFKYNVWDFGGQQIYQSTHQFFLSYRSLYVLVIDSGKDSTGDDDATLNYWLQVVELLGGNSPMLLLQNEKNDRKIQIDIASKRIRFDFLKGDFQINLDSLIPETPKFSSTRLEEFDKFKEEIKLRLKQLPLVGFSMPKNWIRIRQELQQLSKTHPYISKEKYKNICAQYDVGEYERQMELSKIFHDLGVFLHFQTISALDNIIILQNTWATDAVFAVLDNEKVQQNDGKFTDVDIKRIWEHKEYQAEVHSQLLALMMQFELCYKVNNDKESKYIIPEMLAKVPESYVWKPDNDLVLRYTYDFMPKGIMTRFIVRMHSHIAKEEHHELVWKNGVKIDGSRFDCPETYAEITEAWDNKQLLVRAQGKFPRDIMKIVTYEIDSLNNGYFNKPSNDNTQKSRWYKMIPCNCQSCSGSSNIDRHYFEYNRLQKAIEKNKDIQCQISFEDVKVKELLEGVFAKDKRKEQILNDEKIKAKNVFISYSKHELQYCNELRISLSTLARQGLVRTWYDGMIEPGIEWDGEIKRQLADADVVLCLLSPNFMANDYIWNVEMKAVEEKIGSDKIIPVFITKCDFAGTFLSDLNGLINIKHLPPNKEIPSNDNGTIWIASERHQPIRDEYYTIIAQHLRNIIMR